MNFGRKRFNISLRTPPVLHFEPQAYEESHVKFDVGSEENPNINTEPWTATYQAPQMNSSTQPAPLAFVNNDQFYSPTPPAHYPGKGKDREI